MITAVLDIDIRDLILIFIAFFNFILGVFIFFKNRKDKINIYFSFTTFAIVFWTLGLVFFSQTSDVNIALIWARLYYIAAAFIATSFFAFSFVFPFRKYRLLKIYKSFFYIFTIAVVLISVWPRAMLKEIVFNNWGKDVVLGQLYYIYVIYFVICMVGAFGNFIQKYKGLKGIQRIQIQYVFIGTALAVLGGSFFNLFLPLFGNYKLIWLGPYFTLVMIAFFSYAILKHHLMNIKVIATEIFSVFVVLILLIDALLSKTRIEFFVKFGLFIGMVAFSMLLIRAALNEVRAREKITMMAKSLKIANIKLQKLDKTKSEFISIASHQLRTPLTIIKGFLSMILEDFYGPVSDKVRDKIEKSLESNERLIKLVDHLLNLSRIERGKMEFNFKKISLHSIIEKCFEEFEQQAKDKGLKFIYNKFKQDEILIKADEEKIYQVIFNLIDNSIKYTKEGKVEINLNQKGNYAVVSIKDTGIGISFEEKNYLFKKFVRGKKVSRIWTKGVGLGLYVANMIIRAHHGEIGVESAGEDKGSEFWIKLPLIK
ncbi:MAG: ATP-binding protein [bacterium]